MGSAGNEARQIRNAGVGGSNPLRGTSKIRLFLSSAGSLQSIGVNGCGNVSKADARRLSLSAPFRQALSGPSALRRVVVSQLNFSASGSITFRYYGEHGRVHVYRHANRSGRL